MRLIDSDELLDQLETLLKKRKEEAAYTGSREINVRWDDAIISIKGASTIDPVEHGHWIDDNADDQVIVLCSECNRWNTTKTAFCPHCGAKMY